MLFRPTDIFNSVKVLFFFFSNNSWTGGIKVVFHAGGVESRKERERGRKDAKK